MRRYIYISLFTMACFSFTANGWSFWAHGGDCNNESLEEAVKDYEDNHHHHEH